MDISERRALLVTEPNPDRQLDYLVTLSGHLPGHGSSRQIVELRYVPDKQILTSRSFGTYLETLAGEVWHNPEDLAVTVLGDVNNETVTRWIEVRVNIPELQHHAVDNHGVVVEDRQPGWDNPGLMGRMVRI